MSDDDDASWTSSSSWKHVQCACEKGSGCLQKNIIALIHLDLPVKLPVSHTGSNNQLGVGSQMALGRAEGVGLPHPQQQNHWTTQHSPLIWWNVGKIEMSC